MDTAGVSESVLELHWDRTFDWSLFEKGGTYGEVNGVLYLRPKGAKEGEKDLTFLVRGDSLLLIVGQEVFGTWRRVPP